MEKIFVSLGHLKTRFGMIVAITITSAVILATDVGIVNSQSQSFEKSPIWSAGANVQIDSFAAESVNSGKTISFQELSGGVRAIPGFDNPGAVIYHGGKLYIGINGEYGSTNLISVVDITNPGNETITNTIATPVNPIDLAIVDNRIYVIANNTNILYDRSLSGGPWHSIPLPNVSKYFNTYGNAIFPLGNKLFVNHSEDNLIDIVDLDTRNVDHTITELDHDPASILFTDGYMIVLSTGLDAPSCGAYGPNFSVFKLSDYQKVYRKDIHGRCPSAMTHWNGRLYITFDDGIDVYDLMTGNFLDTISITRLSRHIVNNGKVVITQSLEGQLFVIDYNLARIIRSYNLVKNTQPWYPALEEMVAMPANDGRVFITNPSDGTLSIVDIRQP